MKRQRVLVILLAASLAANVCALAAGGYLLYRRSASQAQSRERSARGEGEYAARAAWYGALPAGRADVVFLGDSLTVGFVDDTLNRFSENDLADPWAALIGERRFKGRGIGYDTSGRLLARLDAVIRLRPRRVFMLVGINDLTAGRPPEEVARNVREILRRFQTESPGTKVFVQSVLPVDELRFFRGGNRLVKEANVRLRSVCEEAGAVYIDLHALFADADGQLADRFSDDGLHLYGEAYDLWRGALAGHLADPNSQ